MIKSPSIKALGRMAVLGVTVAAATIFAAQPAFASDLNWNVGDGVVSYTDSTNTLCAHAYNSEGARQVLILNVGRDYNNYYGHTGSTCWYLNRTENSSYTISVNTYWGERGDWVSRGSRTVTI